MNTSMELRVEDGSLNAYCSGCGSKLDRTTKKLEELAATGNFEDVHVLCPKCSAKLRVSIQLGHIEHGVL